jgi:CelD/BcsL family acetyltransferase involved in cellulose biosynthesis
MTEQLRVEIISDLPSMHDIKEEWNELSSRFKTPLLDHEWFVSCAETLYPENDLRIFLLRRTGKIEAIAPLVLSRKGPVRYLQILGVTTLYEPAGLLYKDIAALQRLLEAIIQYGYPVVLERIPRDSPVWNELQQFRYTRTLCFRRRTASSGYLQLTGTWDDFFQRMPASRRTDFRRIRRRADELGSVAFSLLEQDSRELEGVLRTAFAIEASGWKRDGSTAVLAKPLLHDFFSTYLQRICEQGKLRVFFMHIDEEPIAMHLAVEHADRLWILKIGYRQEWSKVSPGLQVCLESIRYAIEHHVPYYEFLGTEEEWQHAWPVQLHTYDVLLVFPYSIHGILGFLQSAISVIHKKIGVKKTFHSRKT